jgi:hypothetical protein
MMMEGFNIIQSERLSRDFGHALTRPYDHRIARSSVDSLLDNNIFPAKNTGNSGRKCTRGDSGPGSRIGIYDYVQPASTSRKENRLEIVQAS